MVVQIPGERGPGGNDHVNNLSMSNMRLLAKLFSLLIEFSSPLLCG